MVVEGEQATLPQLLFNLVKYCREYFQPNATLVALVRNWLQIMFCSTNVLQGRPVDATSMLLACLEIDRMDLESVLKVAQELSEIHDPDSLLSSQYVEHWRELGSHAASQDGASRSRLSLWNNAASDDDNSDDSDEEDKDMPALESDDGGEKLIGPIVRK